MPTAGSLPGDMATVDEDGYYSIVDRKKEMILRGGYNVYPREVEEVLYEHPAVAEAAVMGVPTMNSVRRSSRSSPSRRASRRPKTSCGPREGGVAAQDTRPHPDRRRGSPGPHRQDPEARNLIPSQVGWSLVLRWRGGVRSLRADRASIE